MDTTQKSQTLEMLPSMKKIDAIQCARLFAQLHQTRIDWHEFSYYLDELRTKGILVVSQSGGMIQYRLNK